MKQSTLNNRRLLDSVNHIWVDKNCLIWEWLMLWDIDFYYEAFVVLTDRYCALSTLVFCICSVWLMLQRGSSVRVIQPFLCWFLKRRHLLIQPVIDAVKLSSKDNCAVSAFVNMTRCVGDHIFHYSARISKAYKLGNRGRCNTNPSKFAICAICVVYQMSTMALRRDFCLENLISKL